LRRALPLFLGAGLCFTALDSTAKLLLLRDHALLVVVWARYAGQMAAVTPYARHRLGPDFWRTKHLKVQLVRSLMLVIATLGFFGALRYLPLAEASAISNLAPVFIVLLSPWMLGERPRGDSPRPRRASSACLSCCGQAPRCCIRRRCSCS
jgi:drug/metabolite transporter (DMT)-like permease